MLRIGPVTLSSNLLLAPIAGYCDLAFRTLCREQSVGPDGSVGLGLASTDLLSPQGLLRGTATSLDLAATNDFDKPICMQLYGGDPDIMAQGALWAAEHAATVVDINMGCPVDKVTKKDGGSKLLCIPDTAAEIVRRCRRVLEPFGVPLTCKMRLGWFDPPCEPVAVTLAPRLIDAGVCAVTIHGRTTQQKFAGTVSHDGIARVVEAVGNHCKGAGLSVPVIGNGDVRTASDAVTMLRTTGCAGVMIGRGALSAPWIFRDAWAAVRGLEVPPEPTSAEKTAMIRRYFGLLIEYRGEGFAMVQIRRRMSWFGKRLGQELDGRGRPVGCRPLKEAVRLARTPAEVLEHLAEFDAGGLRGGSSPIGEGADQDADGIAI